MCIALGGCADEPAGASDRLAVALVFDRTEYISGEGVIADVVLTNASDQTFRVWPPELSLEADTVYLQWRRDGHQEQLCAKGIVEFDDTAAILPHGASLAGEAKLFYGGVAGGWTDHGPLLCPPTSQRHPLGPPGTYEVHATVKVRTDGSAGDTQELVTDVTTITVQEPAGDDLDAWDRVLNGTFDRAQAAQLLLYWENGDQLDQAIAAWETIRLEHANTAYFPYATFLRGRRFADAFLNRPADADIAIPMLEQALSLFGAGETTYRRKAYFWLLRAYLLAGRYDDAVLLHQQMQAELGRDPRHQRYLDRAQELVDALP